MQNSSANDTLVTVRPGGWIVCPECEKRKRETPGWRANRSLLKIDPETTAEALTVCHIENAYLNQLKLLEE